MEDLFSYELRDFLMFSASSYFRMIELYLLDLSYIVWVPTVATVIALYIFWRKTTCKPLLLVAGLMNLFVAWQFFLERFQEIMWGAIYFAAAFGLQGVALIWAAQLDEQKTEGQSTPTRVASLVAIVIALLYPVLGTVGIGTIEWVGVTADPTILATVAIVFLSNVSRWLVTLPIVWTVFSALILSALEEPHFWLLPALVALTIGVSAFLKQKDHVQGAG